MYINYVAMLMLWKFNIKLCKLYCKVHITESNNKWLLTRCCAHSFYSPDTFYSFLVNSISYGLVLIVISNKRRLIFEMKYQERISNLSFSHIKFITCSQNSMVKRRLMKFEKCKKEIIQNKEVHRYWLSIYFCRNN